MEKELTSQAAAGRVIHVTVPATVAYDFDKITKVTKTILGKLGCAPCHSGFDIRFHLEDIFAADEKLNVTNGVGAVHY